MYYSWSQEEIEVLLSAVRTHGCKWILITNTYFPNLGVSRVKNKFYSAESYRQRVDNER